MQLKKSKQSEIPADSLVTAFRDGIKLMELIHALHPAIPIPKHNKKPKLDGKF